MNIAARFIRRVKARFSKNRAYFFSVCENLQKATTKSKTKNDLPGSPKKQTSRSPTSNLQVAKIQEDFSGLS